jgi:hypothetical protein
MKNDKSKRPPEDDFLWLDIEKIKDMEVDEL